MSVDVSVRIGETEWRYIITNKGEIKTGLDMEGGPVKQGDYRYRVTRWAAAPETPVTRWFTHHRANGLEACIREAMAAFREDPA